MRKRGTRIQAAIRRVFENWSVPAHSAGNGGAGHDLEESLMESIVYDFMDGGGGLRESVVDGWMYGWMYG